MTKYKLANLGSHISPRDEERLQKSLCGLQGVLKADINAGRREFTLDFTGREPNFQVVKGACESAGLQMERKL